MDGNVIDMAMSLVLSSMTGIVCVEIALSELCNPKSSPL
jgi:hypothetical protein